MNSPLELDAQRIDMFGQQLIFLQDSPTLAQTPSVAQMRSSSSFGGKQKR
jgi:hypothetical protein